MRESTKKRITVYWLIIATTLFVVIPFRDSLTFSTIALFFLGILVPLFLSAIILGKKYSYSKSQFMKAVLAGIAISIGGTASLFIKSMDSGNMILNILGSLIFPFGILMISFLKLDLFTGKISDIDSLNSYENSRKLGYLLPMLLINIGVAIIAGFIIRFICYNNQNLIECAENIALLKGKFSALNSIRILLSAMICGSLVFLSIYFSKRTEGSTRIILSILPIFIFSVCGFEHCIANPFFISVGNGWSWEAIINLATAAVGNSIGAIVLNKFITLSEK